MFLKVPVVDGYSFPHLTKRMNVAGRHITTYLVDLLLRRGWVVSRRCYFYSNNSLLWLYMWYWDLKTNLSYEVMQWIRVLILKLLEISKRSSAMLGTFMNPHFIWTYNVILFFFFLISFGLLQLWLQKGISTGTWDHHSC